MSEQEDKKDKSKLLIVIPLIFLAIVVGAIGLTYMEKQTEMPSDLLVFVVVDNPPYAKDSVGIDHVGGKISHTIPTTQEIIRVLVWANTDMETKELLVLENQLVNAAITNDHKISLGERYFLDILSFTLYPELCDNELDKSKCEFFDLMLNQGLFQDGVIDRDQYWQNVRQYASEEVIAEVEGLEPAT